MNMQDKLSNRKRRLLTEIYSLIYNRDPCYHARKEANKIDLHREEYFV